MNLGQLALENRELLEEKWEYYQKGYMSQLEVVPSGQMWDILYIKLHNDSHTL